MSDTQNLPATTSAAPLTGFQSNGLLDVGALQIWTSFDPTTPAGKAAIVMHMQGEGATPIGDSLNTIVEVQHVLAHRVELLDESTGEIQEADRIVLIRADGSAVACVSAGIKRSLQLITSLYGLPPYNPPMALRIMQKTTRKGRRTYQLSPVVSPTEPSDTPPASARRR